MYRAVHRPAMEAHHIEARVVLPEEKLEAFLEACERVLGTLPALHRVAYARDGAELLEALDHASTNGRGNAAR